MDKIVTQKRCKKCEGTEFYKDGRCKTCRLIRGKKYYAEHSEEERAHSKKYYAEHSEERRAYDKKYHAEHREEEYARKKKYQKEHPEIARTASRKYRAKNLEKTHACSKEYYKRHSEEVYAKMLIERYNITLEQYNEMLTAQNGVCSICGSPPSRRNLDVDHNHNTGKVRGLLCHHCNLILAHALDDKNILRNAANYLEKIQTTNILGDMNQ